MAWYTHSDEEKIITILKGMTTEQLQKELAKVEKQLDKYRTVVAGNTQRYAKAQVNWNFWAKRKNQLRATLDEMQPA